MQDYNSRKWEHLPLPYRLLSYVREIDESLKQYCNSEKLNWLPLSYLISFVLPLMGHNNIDGIDQELFYGIGQYHFAGKFVAIAIDQI